MAILINMLFTFINTSAKPDGWSDDISITIDDDNDSHDTSITTYGNKVHVVWMDANEVFYINSTNNGKTWNQETRLTFFASSKYFPKIDLYEDNLHVVWIDGRDSPGIPKIYYKNSTDGGKKWSDDRRISPLTTDASGGRLDIAVFGSNIHVVYTNFSNEQICYINSQDNGISWSNSITLDFSSSYISYPKIAVNESNIHIIWYNHDNPGLQYINSSDNGMSWSQIITLVTNGGAQDIEVYKNNIHVIYCKSNAGLDYLYYKQSQDDGITWSSEVELTYSPNILYFPDFDVQTNNITIVWSDERDGNREIYYLNSSDNGKNWSNETRLTYNIAQSVSPTVGVNESIIHVVWTDTRDGNPEIYYKHFPVPYPPTNLEINIWLNNLVLNWTPPQNSPSIVTHYHIYRCATWDGFDFSTPWIDTAIESDNGIIPLRTSWNNTGALLDEEWDFFYIVRAIDNEGWNDTNMNIVGKYVIHLDKGWNLISLPLTQKNTTISEVLRTIDGDYNIVQWYDAEQGIWRSSTGDLTEINRTMGLWIHMKSAQNLSIIGAVPELTDIALYEGWNLVGYPSFMSRNPNDALSGINWQAVQKFDALDSSDPWKHNKTNKPENMNDLKEMKPGYGYWVYVVINETWTRTRTVEDNNVMVWRVNGIDKNVCYQVNYEPIYENPYKMKEEGDSQVNQVPNQPTVIEKEDNLVVSLVPLIILISMILAELWLLKRKKRR